MDNPYFYFGDEKIDNKFTIVKIRNFKFYTMNQGYFGKYLTNFKFKNQDQEIEYVIWGDTRDFFAYRQNSTIQVDDNIYPNKIDFWKINNEIFFHPIESEKLNKKIIISIQNELSKLGISWRSHISQKMI